MPSTSQPTRRSSRLWGAITAINIILSLQVSVYCMAVSYGHWQANLSIATSGACATIASDAIMNPFDGRDIPFRQEIVIV